MNLALITRRLNTAHLVMISVALVSLISFASERVKLALILNPFRVKRGEPHRLLTSGWIHADLAHLATNMFVLWIFADPVVRLFGKLMFVLFYASAVVVAFIPTTIRFRNKPRYNSLGASGAVAAVMLSAILLDPTIRLRLMGFPVPGVVFGAGYIAYSVWHSRGSDDNINHDAHFSGALYGALVTFAWAPARVERAVRSLLRLIGL